jgi:hypothetical protein
MKPKTTAGGPALAGGAVMVKTTEDAQRTAAPAAVSSRCRCPGRAGFLLRP